MTALDLAVEHLRMSVLSAQALGADQCAVMAGDLAELLGDYDRLRLYESAGREAARREREQSEAARHQSTGRCEDCFCCIASGCHTGPDATCPTDRLGDSVCPCTGG